MELTDRVLQCQRTGEGALGIVNEVLLQVWRTMARYGDEDAAQEFALYAAPRIARLVQRFQFRGAPFEAAAFVAIRWWQKTFWSDRVRRHEHQATADTCAAVREHAYGEPIAPAEEERQSVELPTARSKSQRRALYWEALAQGVNGSTLLALSAACGKTSQRVASEAGDLDRPERRKRRERFERTASRAYADMMRLQFAAGRECLPERQAELREEAERARKRMHTAQDRLATVRVEATHADIARATGAPKGSIDSAIYWLKHSAQALKGERT